MTNEVTKSRAAFLQAQAREKALRDELTGLEHDLTEARTTEEAAAVAALDGGSEKFISKATAKVRDTEDAIRVRRLQLDKLKERTSAASAALAEALADQRQREQDEDFKQLQDDMANVYATLAALDDALRVAKGRAVSIHQRYRAAGGRDHNIHRFYESLVQIVCNQVQEVNLLERGGSPDVLKVMAPLVSGLQFMTIRSAA